MEKRLTENIGPAIVVCERVAEFVLGILGIISFFFSHTELYLYTGGVLLVLYIVNMLVLGIGPTSGIIASVIGCICLGRIWPGLCMGLNIEAVIVQFIGLIGLIVITLKWTKKE